MNLYFTDKNREALKGEFTVEERTFHIINYVNLFIKRILRTEINNIYQRLVLRCSLIIKFNADEDKLMFLLYFESFLYVEFISLIALMKVEKEKLLL